MFAENCFDELDEKIFDRYIDIKVEPIIGQLEERMYDGRFDWSTCREPLNVREYIKDCITQIVEVCCAGYFFTYYPPLVGHQSSSSMSVCLSVYWLSVCLSVCLLVVCLSVHWLSVCLSTGCVVPLRVRSHLLPRCHAAMLPRWLRMGWQRAREKPLGMLYHSREMNQGYGEGRQMYSFAH